MIYLLQENAIWFLGSVVAGAAITWFMSVRKVDVMVAVPADEAESESD